MARDFSAEIKALEAQIAHVRKEEAEEVVRKEEADLKAAGVVVYTLHDKLRRYANTGYRLMRVGCWALIVRGEKLKGDEKYTGPRIQIGEHTYALACVDCNHIDSMDTVENLSGFRCILTCCSHGTLFDRTCIGLHDARMEIGKVIITPK